MGIENVGEGFGIQRFVVDVTVAQPRGGEAGPDIELLWMRKPVMDIFRP